MPSFGQFFDAIIRVKDKFIPPSIAGLENEHLKKIFSDITGNSIPENEGYVQHLCGPIVASTVQHLNDRQGQFVFRYSVYPVVREEADKYSDLAIYRIYNKRTYILIECKLSVPTILTASDIDSVAQLFLEAIYLRLQEGNCYSDILCVLTNGQTTWHCFHLDLGSTMLTVENYLVITDIEDTLLNRVFEVITHYVESKMAHGGGSGGGDEVEQ